jgi:hypothetical protein
VSSWLNFVSAAGGIFEVWSNAAPKPVGSATPLAPQAIHDLPSVVGATEENGEHPDIARRLINFEVYNKVLVGHERN